MAIHRFAYDHGSVRARPADTQDATIRAWAAAGAYVRCTTTDGVAEAMRRWTAAGSLQSRCASAVAVTE